MAKQVHNVFKGLKAQNLAAFSLFLQCLGQDDFEYIHLESDRGEDFDLVFKDGHKIICESKARKKAFGFSDLKSLLSSLSKKKSIAENDQILVICTNANDRLESILSHIRYYLPPFTEEFTKRKFPKKLIDYLQQVRIWRVEPQYNQKIIYALFDELSQMWLPAGRMEEIISHILWKKIFCKSASGSKYTKRDFFAELHQFRQTLVKDGGILDRDTRKNEDVLRDLLQALMNDAHYIWKPTIISQLSTQPDLLYFVLDKIQKLNLKYDDLSKWATLWNLNKIAHFSFRIFKIFSSNLHTPTNRKYVLNYIKSHINQLRGFYRIDFFIAESSEMLDKILAADSSLTKEAFSLIKDLFACQEPASLFITQQRDQRYERDKISTRLEKVYNSANPSLKDEIYNYILNNFDLINEVGSSDIHTPSNLYSIVRRHLQLSINESDLRKNLLKLVGAFSEQYARDFKRFKMLFQGWEVAGSTGGFWGRNYSVSDRKFVEVILKPALTEYYEKKPKEAWQFIKQYCITPQKKISKTRPDFLNRATIPIVLKRYKSTNKKISSEAFAILKDFILSTKGIPVKFELIYQSIRGDNFTDEQRWKLVQVSLIAKYNHLPIAPFVEQIVTELAKKNHAAARDALKGWFDNPAYFKKHRIVDNAIPNIEAFLESDLPLAIALFEQFIGNDAFINRKDEFDTYDAAVVLQKLLEQNYAKGLTILENLLLIKKPTINQQILISHGFFHHRDPNDKGDTATLTKIFKDYVVLHLKKFSDPVYLTHSHSRASFLQFARKLAISDLISEALVIVKAFINDPDPYSPRKDPEDPEGKYSEQKRIEEGEGPHTITSVRGHCAWTMASCPSIPSRVHVKEIVELTKRLLNDPNWYVRHMACFSLNQLARNRLSVMPPEKKTLYLDINNNQIEALKMAKSIEAMAYKLLEEVSKASENIQKALAESVLSPFGHIRALSQKEAERLLNMIVSSSVYLQTQAAPFLIYLAEFRNNAEAYKDFPWQAPGLYDDLEDFDDTHFKKVLEKWVVEGATEVREKLSWEFWALMQEAYKDKEREHFPIALKYLSVAAQKYEHGVFENIYRFIDDCIKTHFEECFALWQKCLKTEKLFFDKEFDPYKMHWWPHHYNGRILLEIKDRMGDAEYLRWLEFLSSYPEGSRLEDLKIAVEPLLEMVSADKGIVKRIFDNLINFRRESSYRELKESWEGRQ